MVRPRVGATSQTERLVAQMQGRAVTHGQTVRADLANVMVSSNSAGVATIYFCAMRDIAIRGVVEAGDGGPLPTEVDVDGLELEHEGLYDIENALVSSNGRISVKIDERSRIAPAVFAGST